MNWQKARHHRQTPPLRADTVSNDALREGFTSYVLPHVAPQPRNIVPNFGGALDSSDPEALGEVALQSHFVKGKTAKSSSSFGILQETHHTWNVCC